MTENRTHQQGLTCPHCFKEVHGEAQLTTDMGSILFAIQQAVRDGILNLKLVKNRRKDKRGASNV